MPRIGFVKEKEDQGYKSKRSEECCKNCRSISSEQTVRQKKRLFCGIGKFTVRPLAVCGRFSMA